MAFPIGFVQSNNANTASSVSTLPCAYNNPNNSQSLLVAQVAWLAATGDVQSISDSAGNSYTAASPVIHGSTSSMRVFYCTSCLPIASNTVTAVLTAAATGVGVAVGEWQGISGTAGTGPFDVQVSATAATGTAASSGNVTTTYPNELLIGLGNCTTTTLSAVGSGFTQRVLNTTNVNLLIEDQYVTSVGSYAGTFTITATDPWIAQLITFKLFNPFALNNPFITTSPEPYVVLRGDGTTVSQDATNRSVTVPPIY